MISVSKLIGISTVADVASVTGVIGMLCLASSAGIAAVADATNMDLQLDLRAVKMSDEPLERLATLLAKAFLKLLIDSSTSGTLDVTALTNAAFIYTVTSNIYIYFV